jgi:two-component system, chemotaxis family, protein-glutamate methylesterase/glutaminase
MRLEARTSGLAAMTRVLVVDDSAVVRSVLTSALAQQPDFEVIAAVDPYDARDKVIRFAPDVITLDIEMPRMDGLSFLARLMAHHPVPVVIVSSLTPMHSEAAVRALQLGAVGVIAKPATPAGLVRMAQELRSAVRTAASIDPARLVPVGRRRRAPGRTSTAAYSADCGRLIAIGASTGGPSAIEQVLAGFPASAPCVLIVQHMPAGFTAAFARRLDAHCALDVREARDGSEVAAGVALVAPGGMHMVVQRSPSGLCVAVKKGPPVHYQRPSVDVLFHSVAHSAGGDAVGVLLTGMGSDGASGMRALRDAGAHTIAQDEASSVVFSMPGEAIRFGGAADVLPLPRIGRAALAAATAPHGRPQTTRA